MRDRQKYLARKRRYYQNHKEACNAYSREYSKKNHDKLIIHHREYVEHHRDKYRRFAREGYQRRKEKILAKQQKIRFEVFTHYGGNPPKCACCDESHIEFLTIDHINSSNKSKFGGNKTGHHLYDWIIKNHYPEEFQVLCWNCNCVKGIYGVCPHKKEKKGGFDLWGKEKK